MDHVKALYIREAKDPEFNKQNVIDRLTPPEGGLIRLMPKKGDEKWVTILGQ